MIKVSRRGLNGMMGTALLAETFAAAWPALSKTAMGAVQTVPIDSDKLAALSLTEVSEMIHARTVTSTQLVKALLGRINIYNPKVNCYITVMGRTRWSRRRYWTRSRRPGGFAGHCMGSRLG